MTHTPARPTASRPEKTWLTTDFASWWPEPGTPRTWVPGSAAGVGLLVALLIPGAPRPGIDLLICGLAAALPVGLLAYRRGRRAGRRWPVGRVAILLGLVAVGLVAVSAVRASEWLAWGCAVAAMVLGAAVALDARRWPAVLATVPLFGVAVLRALPWAGPATRLDRLRPTRPWLTGVAVGTLCTAVVGGLLASADDAFADLLIGLWPSVDLGLLPARALMFIAATATVLGALFAVSTELTVPRPARGLTAGGLTAGTMPGGGRPPAEWLTPLVLVAITIMAFLVFEATMLFGGAVVVQRVSSVSHAERAQEGFGQLTAVTLIVLALLAWAGRAAAAGPPRHRRLMGMAGGLLLVLALLLGGSALRRLWLYQEAYGWTVTRLNAGAFEIWVAVVLFGVAVGWLARRTDLLPRFGAGSAGLGLLVMGLLGPDALVATANVHRFEQTQKVDQAGKAVRPGKIDTAYLAALSADAVPALDRLPEPERSCVLAGRTQANDPWFGWNLSRSRADALLTSRPPGPC
jgi:hypothetical protein